MDLTFITSIIFHLNQPVGGIQKSIIYYQTNQLMIIGFIPWEKSVITFLILYHKGR